MVCVCYKMVYGLWFGGVCLGFGAVIWNLWCDCCVWLVVIRFGVWLLVWVTFPVGLFGSAFVLADSVGLCASIVWDFWCLCEF